MAMARIIVATLLLAALPDLSACRRRMVLSQDFKRLGRELRTGTMQRIHLDFYADEYSHDPGIIKCHGTSCPSFAACGPAYPNIHACWNDFLVDRVQEVKPEIVLCPAARDKRGRPVISNDTCMHRGDALMSFKFSHQVFRLTDMFIHSGGQIFNDSHVVSQRGCSAFGERSFSEDTWQGMIPSSTPVLNWGYSFHRNFYHFVAEAIPALVVGLMATSGVPGVQVLASQKQWHNYDKFGAPLLGLKTHDIGKLSVGHNTLHHADVLYQPLYPQCGVPSKAVWSFLRRTHLLHPDGLPIFAPDGSHRTPSPPITDDQRLKLPADWLVIVARRHGKREIKGMAHMKALLNELFGRKRVMDFDGSIPILEAKEMFQKARLFVGATGAALTNMIFMKENSTVLEIRPRGLEDTRYHSLAYACGINYFLLMGKGDKETVLKVAMDDLLLHIAHIKDRFDTEDGIQFHLQ